MFDDENGLGKLLNILFFAGAYLAGEYAGKKKIEDQYLQQTQFDSQQAQLNELNRLKQENEELKRKMPKIISSTQENQDFFPSRL